MDGWEKKRILMVVKTYPTPSEKYHETVCTAGITDSGEWIRLYPVQFRYLDRSRQFEKYTWIDVDAQRRIEDIRPESYRADGHSIEKVRWLDPKKDLAERKKVLLPLLMPSYEQIRQRYAEGHYSLGIFKPRRVLDFVIKPGVQDWTEKQKNVLAQTSLFDQQDAKTLEKVPWDFSYQFVSADDNVHTLKITDWETYQAFRAFRDRYASEEDALQKLRDKYMGFFTDPSRDSYLIVGTVYPYPTFIVIGVFSYPKDKDELYGQTKLF